MSIADVVLFYSKFSPECKDCVNFVHQSKLPVILIALDTKESREYASNGSLIQIKNVPSMVVSYTDGNVQLYVGKQKIMGWFTAITQGPAHKPPEPTQTTKAESERREKPKQRNKKKKPIKSSKKVNKHNSEDSGDGIELIFEENPQKQLGVPGGVSSKLSTKPVNVSPNAGIMSLANQMMAERNLQIGGKDNDG